MTQWIEMNACKPNIEIDHYDEKVFHNIICRNVFIILEFSTNCHKDLKLWLFNNNHVTFNNRQKGIETLFHLKVELQLFSEFNPLWNCITQRLKWIALNILKSRSASHWHQKWILYDHNWHFSVRVMKDALILFIDVTMIRLLPELT